MFILLLNITGDKYFFMTVETIFEKLPHVALGCFMFYNV